MQEQETQIRYAIDIVLCMDCTMSMRSLIDRVKDVALSFDSHLLQRLEARRIMVDNLRVRVVAFRDLADHGSRGLEVSTFFSLPAERNSFEEFVSKLQLLAGGRTFPESGLVGLASSIGSDWTTSGEKRRHVIAIWADEPPHPLEIEPLNEYQGFPRTFDELSDRWMNNQGPLTPGSKRLILFAPDSGVWASISEHWDNVVHRPSRAGEGVSEGEFNQMIDTIAASI